MANELIAIETVNPIEVFAKNGTDPIINKIKEMVNDFDPDMTTPKGRKEIASLAHKIARSKTALDDLGKNLVADKKSEIKLVDAERRRMRDELDAIKEGVRAPLTEWEEAEKNRVKQCNDLIEGFAALESECAAHWQDMPVAVMESYVADIEDVEKTHGVDWREFQHAATEARTKAITTIKECIERKKKHVAEQAELARLRKEAEEKERKEREERLAAEAAEKARIEAEEKAQREKDELERQKQELEAKAQREKEQAEQAAKEAAERAEREKNEAVEAERKRAQEEKEREEAEAARREANKRHKGKINREARDALMEAMGFDEKTAKAIIQMIAVGEVPHVTITY